MDDEPVFFGCGDLGGVEHPAFPTPSVGRKFHAQPGRIAPREAEVCLMHANAPCHRRPRESGDRQQGLRESR